MEYLPSPEDLSKNIVQTDRDREVLNILDPKDEPQAYLENVYMEVEVDQSTAAAAKEEDKCANSNVQAGIFINSANNDEPKQYSQSRKRRHAVNSNYKKPQYRHRDRRSGDNTPKKTIVLKKVQSNVMLNLKFRKQAKTKRESIPLSFLKGASETLVRLYTQQYYLNAKILAAIKKELETVLSKEQHHHHQQQQQEEEEQQDQQTSHNSTLPS